MQAIKLVANGEVWIDQKVIRLLAEQFIFPGHRLEGKETSFHLDAREREVLDSGILYGFLIEGRCNFPALRQ